MRRRSSSGSTRARARSGFHDPGDIFREVFGDAAIGHRIRPLIEFQYANANNTAGSSFDFLDG